MKLLILSCNTGEGHNSSARALKKYMDSHNIECEVADTIGLVSEAASKTISDTYIYSTKTSLFQYLYRMGGKVSNLGSNIFKSPIYTANKLYAKKLYDYIIVGQFDAVVCVHLFPAEALTALKHKAELHVPAVFIMTDYTCIPFLPETELDSYVIAHEDLVEEYVEKGIQREKIVPIGIPIDEEKFSTRIDKETARRAAEEEFGWSFSSRDSHWFLVMSGSMGFGNLGGLVSELLQKADASDRIICICGRNEETRAALAEEFKEDRRLEVIGYTDKVSMLMDACDVLFSKPGGITSTEATIKNIPLIHTAPIPGLEDYNARFFHYHNMSYSTIYPDQQAAVAIRLCNDEAYRERMLSAQKRNANPHTCQQITDLVVSLVEQHKQLQ